MSSNVQPKSFFENVGLTLDEGVKKVSNWTSDAKNWAVAHKKEILTAAMVAGLFLAVIGAGVAAYAFATKPFLTLITKEVMTWEYCSSIFTTNYTINFAPKFLEGIIALIAGSVIVNETSKSLNS